MFLMELVRLLSGQLTTACNSSSRGLLHSSGLCLYFPAQTWHIRKHYKFKNVFKLIKKKSLYKIRLNRNYHVVNIFFYSAFCI